jgi:hypothetical protein
MSAPTGSQYAVGLRFAVAFELNVDGYPNAGDTPATPYEGLEIKGPKTWDLTIPDSRRISHQGNDRVLALDVLPPTEGLTGVLVSSADDMDVKAALTGVKVRTLGEAKLLPVGTDQQGTEPEVALLLFQQSKDAASRLRRWRMHLIPRATCKPDTGAMNENGSETKYNVVINPSTSHLWGTALNLNDDGCEEAALLEGMFEGRPKLVAWKGDAAEDEFLLPATKPATATTKIHGVWVNGTPVSGDDITLAVDKLTFDTPPADDAMIVCLYEY